MLTPPPPIDAPNRKLGRNEKCWCGSGLKFKKCHLGRDRDQPVSKQEMLALFKAAGNQKMCLHPSAGSDSCQGAIVQAHTIQKRGGGLVRIAASGHVYGYRPGVDSFEKNHGILKPMPIGMHQASTFTGFCKRHDDELFKPLENNPFAWTLEQITLLGYRALCRELFAKLAARRLTSSMTSLDRGKPLDHQVLLQDLLNTRLAGIEAGIKDLQAAKANCDDLIQSGRYDDTKYFAAVLGKAPDVMCSAAWTPEVDLTGNRIQSLLNDHIDYVCVSLFATDSGGAAVINWTGDNSTAMRLADSLDAISDERFSDCLIQLCFEYLENIFWSPKWWDSLYPEQQADLIERIQHNVDEEPQPGWFDRVSKPLADWQVLKRIRAF